ncbi:MAG TPA: DUF1566 domain-containing protein [Polyangiaceae bacterium]|nr:DUF1566 domain-containing protein [Polyangiaceae bacterium]
MRIDLSACWCCALLAACALSACGCDEKPDPGGGSGASGNQAGSAGEAGAAGSAGEAGLNESDAAYYARWPMPNSAGLGLPNPADYDAEATPGVVHDRVTGLDWLQDPGTELYARADAISRCSELSFAGFDDWRVPAFIELVSLFDELPNQADPNVPIYIAPIFRAEGRFWSTSPISADGLGRLLDFTADGCSSSHSCSMGVRAPADSPLGSAFCVRSSEPPAAAARYELDGDRVTDLHTGLVWQTVPAQAQTGAYTDALSACAALGDGTRLPSITELLSILVPILDKRAFPNWPSDAFAWTSSAIPVKPDNYWVAAIGGATRAVLSTTHNRVQCVR